MHLPPARAIFRHVVAHDLPVLPSTTKPCLCNLQGLKPVPEHSEADQLSPVSPPTTCMTSPPALKSLEFEESDRTYDLAGEWSSIHACNEAAMRLHRELML